MITEPQPIDTIKRVFATTPREMRSELRRNGVTIRELAKRLQITLKAVRARLNSERLIPGNIALDWIEAVRGALPPRIKAALRSMHKNAETESAFELSLIARKVSF